VRGQSLGAQALYRFGTLTTVDREPGAVNRFSASGAGTSLEQVFGAGLSLEYILLPSLSLKSSLCVGALMGSFVSDSYRSFDSTRQQHFEVASSALVFEAAAVPTFKFGQVRLGVGPVFDLFALRSSTVKEISDDLRGTTTDSSIANKPATIGRFAAAAELGYELPFAMHPAVMASIHYDPYVNRFRPFAEALQIGVGIQVPFFTEGQSQEPASVQSESVQSGSVQSGSVQPGSPINVRFGDRDLSQDSVLPVSVSYIHRQIYEELPLSFPVDSIQYLARDAATRFSEIEPEVVASMDRQVLNILAARMKSRPAAILTLSGGPTATRKAAQYLHDIWQVSNHVRIDSVSDDRHIHVTSDDAVLLLPVSRQVIERSVTLPRIVVSTGDSEAYDLVIAADRDTLLHKFGLAGVPDNSITTLPANIDLNKPLRVSVSRGRNVYTHYVTLRPFDYQASQSEIEVAFRPSHSDTLVLRNRALLFGKLQGRVLSVRVDGQPDGEATLILQRFGFAQDLGTTDSAEWRVRILCEDDGRPK
jgi:hypothetical protein